MHGDLAFGSGTLYAFLLVLARISGAFVLVPLPSFAAGSEAARVVASLAITVSLLPFWPRIDEFPSSIGVIVLAILAEAAFGITIGLAVACLNEMLKMGAQMMSLQSGFGYSTIIDPNSSADAGLLVVAAEVIGGLLFFSLGLHREVIRIFAMSLATHPPGVFHADAQLAEAFWRFAADIFTVGVRLAFPAIALLGLVDISLGLMGRINSQLQLVSIAFPLKMLTALALTAVLATMYPRIIREEAAISIHLAERAAGVESRGR